MIHNTNEIGRNMQDQDYVVFSIKDTEPVRQSANSLESDDLLGGALAIAKGGETLVSRMTRSAIKGTAIIERASLNERQAADEARDPDKVVVLDMPVSLVAPVAEKNNGDRAGTPVVTKVPTDGVTPGIREILGSSPDDLTGAGVRVAVLDTGIMPTHAAFENMSLKMRNFAGENVDDANDGQGHGTHCAGTIFGRDVDGIRIGVARGVEDVLIGKVLDDEGRGKNILCPGGFEVGRIGRSQHSFHVLGI